MPSPRNPEKRLSTSIYNESTVVQNSRGAEFWVACCFSIALFAQPTPFIQTKAQQWLGWLPKGFHQKTATGFTLAELLICLAILGIIATFAIPKIITAQQNGAYNAAAHEAIGTISTAYQLYQQNNAPVSSSTTAGALTQYMNYTSVPTSGALDDIVTGNATYTCNSNATCLRLHNGGTLYYRNVSFSAANSTNCVYFFFDPDSVQGTSGAADGPGKALSIILYYNGRVSSYGQITPGSVSSLGTYNPGGYDPGWFTW